MWESKRLRELCKKCQVVVVSHLRESFNQNVTLSISLAFFYLVAEMMMQQGGYRFFVILLRENGFKLKSKVLTIQKTFSRQYSGKKIKKKSES